MTDGSGIRDWFSRRPPALRDAAIGAAVGAPGVALLAFADGYSPGEVLGLAAFGAVLVSANFIFRARRLRHRRSETAAARPGADHETKNSDAPRRSHTGGDARMNAGLIIAMLTPLGMGVLLHLVVDPTVESYSYRAAWLGFGVGILLLPITLLASWLARDRYSNVTIYMGVAAGALMLGSVLFMTGLNVGHRIGGPN